MLENGKKDFKSKKKQKRLKMAKTKSIKNSSEKRMKMDENQVEKLVEKKEEFKREKEEKVEFENVDSEQDSEQELVDELDNKFEKDDEEENQEMEGNADENENSLSLDHIDFASVLPKLNSKKKSLKSDAISGSKSTAASSSSVASNVVYLGRIPHGFYEEQMMSYFSQFGEIIALRLARNKKSGASKHYAFIQFDSSAVAAIVVDTMHNYLLSNRLLKCMCGLLVTLLPFALTNMTHLSCI
jgi:nucleolar protein 15